ncbi:hypothetical protein RMSM_07333, partial [Rhodopirellula maiorica SM1]
MDDNPNSAASHSSVASERRRIDRPAIRNASDHVASVTQATAPFFGEKFSDQSLLLGLVGVIAVTLVCGTLFVASSLFVPIVIATLAYLSLRPIAAR